jgi:curved DNA-binding protein CbpA
MDTDCYAVLGLSRDANLSQIRRAFRRLAHRLDPDHRRPPDEAPFQEIGQAYDTLSHTSSRADHDRELQAHDADEARPRELVPARHVLDDYDRHHPSREDIERAMLDDYTDRLPKARPMRAVRVEVAMPASDVAAGGVVPFDVPAAWACAACDGTGRAGFFRCDACEGRGVTWTTARVEVSVPAGTPADAGIPASLAPLGLSTLYLDVSVRVTSPAPTSQA